MRPTASELTAPTSTSTATPAQASARTLRRLYVVRFLFACAWAALLATTASSLGALAIGLLIVYPAFDVVAAVVDGRSSAWPAGLRLNIVISTVAVGGVAVASVAGIPAVLRVWGAWAIAAGVVQLIVGTTRRRLGGQWPMMLSGGISVIAGSTFVLSASDADSVSNIAGYGVLGGIFFLVSALRLGRTSGVDTTSDTLTT